jgi:hypothetical protein
VISVIRSRRVRHRGDVENRGRTQIRRLFLWGNVKEEACLQVLGLNGRIILKRISKK